MTLEEYHKWVYSLTSKDWDPRMHGLVGLTSEVGEIADAIKKECAYGRKLSAENGGILEESGDVLFYLSMLLEAEGHTLQEALDHNVGKLSMRYSNGKFSKGEALARKDKSGEQGL